MNSSTAKGAVMHFAVPGVGSFDMRGSQGEAIATDAYGRVLFRSDVYDFNEGTAAVYAIYQAYDDDYVYFYEDICYLLFSEDVEPTAEELAALKLENDWEKPLDNSKMSRRKVYVSYWLKLHSQSNLDRERIMAAWCTTLGIGDRGVLFGSADVDHAGQEAFVFWSNSHDVSNFYLIVDASYQIQSLPFEDIYDLHEKLPAFKKECGWTYGF